MRRILFAFAASLLLLAFFDACQEPREKSIISLRSLSQQSPVASHQVALEVLQASKDWIAAFNRDDVGACIEVYLPHARMRAEPFGLKKDRKEISDFWKPFLASGASNLAYTQVGIEVANDTTAFLSANWSMSSGSGVVYQEKWVKRGGLWKLSYVDWEMQEKYDTPIVRDVDPTGSHSALEDVLKASMDWISNFNARDGQACGKSYLDKASMNAEPFANLDGREAITAFWAKLIEDGAKKLVYSNVRIRQVNDHAVRLASDWSMNIGSGRIYQEKWVKTKSGWRLGYDEFEEIKQP
ncbi:MAG: hypothetical protein MI784_14395 [Cytophagales bacterium]|nr:hypothetical protein [Cytophagales bacterium]